MSQILDAGVSRSRLGGPSFSRANRWERAIFMLAWAILARWTPPAFHPWRAAVLKLFGAQLGRNVRIHASVAVWLPRHLRCGDNVLIGPGAILYAMAPITIGAESVVSQRAHLCAGTHQIDDPSFALRAKPLRIGRRCWVAAEAFVGPGVELGDGAVLGARAVAFKNLAAWTVYVGNPARPTRERRRC